MDESPIPAYRRDVDSGFAVATISGQKHVLGRWLSDESFARFRLLVSPLSSAEGGVSIAELCSRYRDHARTYYRRRDGTQTGEAKSVALSLRELEAIFGSSPAVAFSLGSLLVVREEMIRRDLSRGVINQRIGRIRRMFKWAIRGLCLPADVYESLLILEDLPAHRSEARECDPVEPVPREAVEATLPHVSPVVRAMIIVLLASGMRPGEIVVMRALDLDRREAPWLYIPMTHKLAHRGKSREVFLGSTARAAIEPFLVDRPPGTFLFSAAESRAWWNLARRTRRRSLMVAPGCEPAPRDPQRRAPRDRFDTNTLDHAIAYGVQRAGVPSWSANQLRHTAAMGIRARFGLEAVAVALGHADVETSQVYADSDRALARKVAEELG